MTAHRAILEELYAVGVAAAQPRALVEEAIGPLYDGGAIPGRVAVLAIGKAAPTMAEAAVELLTRRGASVTGGLVVSGSEGRSPHPAIVRVAGDHPLPGSASRRAAAMLTDAIRRARDEADRALVLVSGGATSLVGSPVPGISMEVLTTLFEGLLRSGWDIGEMNAIRKRFLQWGAGRLALALEPLIVHPIILSDVIGDDPAIIASGPCTPDALTALDIRERLARLAIHDAPRRALVAHLDRVAAGELAETPKPGDPAFGRVAAPVLRGNATAVSAIERQARDVAGWPVVVVPTPVRGEARERGAEIARRLLSDTDGRRCIIYSGETTVTIPAAAAGRGGRCQELALSAARVLDADYERAASIAVMAAGTDGRDGPTDAAGAIVDRDTWRRAQASGAAPDVALATHDSHAALAAAGALIPSRVTGTNVMDIIVGVVGGR